MDHVEKILRKELEAIEFNIGLKHTELLKLERMYEENRRSCLELSRKEQEVRQALLELK